MVLGFEFELETIGCRDEGLLPYPYQTTSAMQRGSSLQTGASKTIWQDGYSGEVVETCEVASELFCLLLAVQRCFPPPRASFITPGRRCNAVVLTLGMASGAIAREGQMLPLRQ